jgi:hypothetical protein
MEQAQQYVLECLMMSQNPEVTLSPPRAQCVRHDSTYPSLYQTQKAGEEKLSQANKQEGKF